MNKIVLCSIFLILFGCGDPKYQSESKNISLEDIQGMFANMKSKGVNTDTTMLWGYFFTSDKKDKFSQVAGDLKLQKFEFVEIYQADDKSYWLHLERKEVHNAKSLYHLDEELYKVADRYKILYDGFDVGNVNKSKPIASDKIH